MINVVEQCARYLQYVGDGIDREIQKAKYTGGARITVKREDLETFVTKVLDISKTLADVSKQYEIQTDIKAELKETKEEAASSEKELDELRKAYEELEERLEALESEEAEAPLDLAELLAGNSGELNGVC